MTYSFGLKKIALVCFKLLIARGGASVERRLKKVGGKKAKPTEKIPVSPKFGIITFEMNTELLTETF